QGERDVHHDQRRQHRRLVAAVPRLSEADLARHLRNGNGKEDKERSTRASDPAVSDLRAQDNQLYEALHLLKGIVLSRGARDSAAGEQSRASDSSSRDQFGSRLLAG
ncbi:MAG TPA: hypothetical protein PKC08_11140, partial [Pseudomonadales bacterium]|nr:hypothetical protein [Pseudomonadales bacterium]